MEQLKELKEKAYSYATQHRADDSNYLSAEDQIEAMKAYALLVMAEKLTVQN